MNKRLSVASRAVLLLAIGGWTAGLAACGQKGPLTLPNDDKADKGTKAATQAPAHAVSAPTPAASAASAP